MKSKLLSLVALLFITSCVNRMKSEESTFAYTNQPNHVQMDHYKGHLKEVIQTVYEEVEQVDSEWFPDSTGHIMKFIYSFNKDGYLIQKRTLWYDDNNNTLDRITKYEFTNGLPSGGITHVNDTLHSSHTVKEFNEKEVIEEHNYIGIGTHKLTFVLNAKHRTKEFIVSKLNTTDQKTFDVHTVTTNNYHQDSSEYTEVTKYLFPKSLQDADMTVEVHYTTLEEDAYGNPTYQLVKRTSSINDKVSSRFKIATYEYKYY